MNATSVPSWSRLARLGQSRVMKSSYFWFLFVPICSKMLGTVNELQFSFLSDPIQLSLPFQWRVFYFSSLCFAAATLLFTWKCPLFIQRFGTWAVFYKESRSGYRLLTEAAEFARHCVTDTNKRSRWLGKFAKDFTESPYSMPGAVRPPDISEDELLLLTPKNERLTDSYAFLISAWDSQRPRWRATCSILYGIGFFLLGIVVIQNIWFVIRISFFS